MARRIIVTDGDWSDDTLQFVPRQEGGQTIAGLEAGEVHLTNTRTRETAYVIEDGEIVVAPQLEVIIAPNPVIAGQEFVATFSAAPDSVDSNVTLTGSGQVWRGIAPETGNLTLEGGKGGWTGLEASYAVRQPDPQLILSSDRRLQILHMTAQSPAKTLTLVDVPAPYTGAKQINPALLAQGPAAVVPPFIVGDAGVGATWTFNRGMIASLYPDHILDFIWPDGSEGLTYVARSADQGQARRVSGTISDANGTRPFETNAITVPAAVAPPPTSLANGITDLGAFDGGTASSSSTTNTASIPLGPADPGKKLFIWLAGVVSTSAAKITVGGVDYLGQVHENKSLPSNSSSRLVLVEIPCPAGGTGILHVTGINTARRPRGYVEAAKNLSLLTTLNSAFNMTAGTSFASSVGATQVGDTILRGILTLSYNPAGLFSNASLLTEVFDAPIAETGPQLWLGRGVETAASSNRSLPITPAATAEYASVVAILRNS